MHRSRLRRHGWQVRLWRHSYDSFMTHHFQHQHPIYLVRRDQGSIGLNCRQGRLWVQRLNCFHCLLLLTVYNSGTLINILFMHNLAFYLHTCIENTTDYCINRTNSPRGHEMKIDLIKSENFFYFLILPRDSRIGIWNSDQIGSDKKMLNTTSFSFLFFGTDFIWVIDQSE